MGPPVTLTLPTVKFSRCQTRKSRIVTPPHRISPLANVAPVRFFITYGTVRAARARRHSVAAAKTCTTRAMTSPIRITQSRPVYGSIG